jgi:hypothetical protein
MNQMLQEQLQRCHALLMVEYEEYQVRTSALKLYFTGHV